jgi:hypothetical protein
MPLYEYYCADCRTTFEALRPMSNADATIRALSLFAALTKGETGLSPVAEQGGFGGSCCGGGACGCAH